MPRVTTPTNRPELNRQLAHIDALQKRIEHLEQMVKLTKTKIDIVANTHVPATSNDLTFTWTGTTALLSWGTGSVRDRSNNNVPVTSGSIQLTPSTYYWLAWNPVHQVMVPQIGVDGLLQNEHNIVICQLFTGTLLQTGAAGGGGSSSSGSDLSGSRYKLF